MKKTCITILVFCLSPFLLSAQSNPGYPSAPKVNDFIGTISFLSSDLMEGREAGTRGSYMAADYIASRMLQTGLKPFGKFYPEKSLSWSKLLPHTAFLDNFFQDFFIIRYQTEKTALEALPFSADSGTTIQFSSGIDFEVQPVPDKMHCSAFPVFAGYGIESNLYNDYQNQDFHGKILIVLDGFPGHADTTSRAWAKLGKTFGEKFSDADVKTRLAEKHGALALIILNLKEKIEPDYDNSDCILPDDTSMLKIPCFRLSQEASSSLIAGTNININEFESKAAIDLLPVSFPVMGKMMRFSMEIKKDTLYVRNVLGIIPGKDSSKSILVGAHYDHLGMRKGLIYHGSDDNASGVAGMLALAQGWANRIEKPAMNIIFAAWAAEEKGLLGSSHYVQQSLADSSHIKLLFNMDMISRSAPEDSSRLQLSIGTLPISENLRQLAVGANLSLNHPFQLDLWDVTGHTGSDYAPFAQRNIPVMTFFSGFHNDYHTPDDVAIKADPDKMEQILKLVNACLLKAAGFNPAW